MSDDNRTEEFEISGEQLVERVKAWVAEGNVRRIIFRAPDDTVMLDMTLTAALIGGAFTLAAPWLAVIGSIAALATRMRVEVIRDPNAPPAEDIADRTTDTDEAVERLSNTGTQKVKIQVED